MYQVPISGWPVGIRGTNPRMGNSHGMTPVQRRVYTAFEPRTLAALPSRRLGQLGDDNQAAYVTGAVSYGTSAGATILTGPGDTAQNLVLSAPAIMGSVVSSAAAMGASWATAAIPFVGPAIAAITVGLQFFFRNGQQKKQASHIADYIEPKMKENLAAYANGPHTQASQAQALANFDALWQALLQACSDPKLGSAGGRCISERQQGGTAPWCPNPGGTGCDWFALYRTPIANDQAYPNTTIGAYTIPSTAAPTTTTGAANAIAQQAADGYSSTAPGAAASLDSKLPLLIGAGLLLLGVMSS